MSSRPFQLEAGTSVRAWMDAHPSSEPRVIAYDVRWCCGGGKICQVKVRVLSSNDNPDAYRIGVMDDGTRFLIDPRAAKKLPARFGLIVRGFGPLKHLDLDLESEQWGDLLYT